MQVLVARSPSDTQLALVGARPNHYVADLDHRLGGIDLDPKLRAVANLRGAITQPDPALGQQGDAVEPLGLNVENNVGFRWDIAGTLKILVPAPAVLGVPQFDLRDARRPHILDLIIETDALAADELALPFPGA